MEPEMETPTQKIEDDDEDLKPTESKKIKTELEEKSVKSAGDGVAPDLNHRGFKAAVAKPEIGAASKMDTQKGGWSIKSDTSSTESSAILDVKLDPGKLPLVTNEAGDKGTFLSDGTDVFVISLFSKFPELKNLNFDDWKFLRNWWSLKVWKLRNLEGQEGRIWLARAAVNSNIQVQESKMFVCLEIWPKNISTFW